MALPEGKDRVGKLLKFARFAGMGQRSAVIARKESEARAEELKLRATQEADARWAELPATKRFIKRLEDQITAHKEKRDEEYANHLAMVAHTTWETALTWAIRTIEAKKVSPR